MVTLVCDLGNVCSHVSWQNWVPHVPGMLLVALESLEDTPFLLIVCIEKGIDMLNDLWLTTCTFSWIETARCMVSKGEYLTSYLG